MLRIQVTVPPPSQYLKYDEIDTIATQYNKAYREQSGNQQGHPVDVEQLIDLLEISVLHDDIEEPDGALFLARYTPAPRERITINKRHVDLFNARPDVYSSAIGHEIGHKILRHTEILAPETTAPSLFPDDTSPARHFHKSTWGQFGMTREEVLERKALVQQIARQALVSDQARRVIAQLQCFFEPEWVFWQAEHFSRCLLIPRDRLLEQMENPWDLSRWQSIYRLAEMFGVSGSVMKRRLEKLGVIKIGEDGQPHPAQATRQKGLLDIH
jgi:hypothetical protein